MRNKLVLPKWIHCKYANRAQTPNGCNKHTHLALIINLIQCKTYLDEMALKSVKSNFHNIKAKQKQTITRNIH